MIPKVIHYCWFGKKRKPKLVRDCIKSWKKYLPNYHIIEWNESNSDLSHPFVKEVYKIKKWAFVSDFIRLKVLYENGGIYLDTDMKLIKPLDKLLKNECFFGAEDENYISCGIIGSNVSNEFINKCLEKYNSIDLDKIEFHFGEISSPKIVTSVFKLKYNYSMSFRAVTCINGIVIYPFQYFYPFPFEKKLNINNYKDYILAETYAVHLWNSSWIDHSEFYYIRNREYLKGLIKVLNKIVEEKKIHLVYLKKIGSCFKESLNYKNE